jgi:hypothetical protein
MESSARLYNCACCHQLVVLCSGCDRGNIYCFDGCAEQQRIRSLRAANKPYRNTRNGKRNAARRQARFRARARENAAESPPSENKVTHHGSAPPAGLAPMDGEPTPGRKAMNSCHGCGKPLDGYLRLGFVRRHTPLLVGSFPVQSG